MGRADRIVFLVLACGAYTYVISRAILVPPIHDEAVAFYLYVLTGDFVPFVAKWGAGNHVLQSALGQISFFLFGPDLFGLRIWCVLGYALYAWYTWRLGAWLHDRMVRWCAWSALLYVPFMVEFFSLARGYGMAFGFWAMALFHVVRYVEKERQRDEVAALIAMVFAVWSLLSLLMVWCGTLVLLFVVVVRNRCGMGRTKPLLLWATLGLLPFIIAVLFILAQQEHGAFHAGLERGYLGGTVASLFASVLRVGEDDWATVFGLVIMVWACGFLRPSHPPDHELHRVALLVLSSLALFDMGAQSIASTLLGARTPMDRAALYLVPLAVLAFSIGVDVLSGHRSWFRSAALFMLVLPLRTLLEANLDHTQHWPEQAIPDRFYSIVGDRQRKAERPLVIGAQQFLAWGTWTFGAKAHDGWVNELERSGFPQPLCDLLMVDSTLETPPPGFRTIATAPSGRNNLMERISPLHAVLRSDSTIACPMSDREFIPLWESAAAPWRGRVLLYEFAAGIRSALGTTGAQVVVSVESGGAHVSYDAFAIDEQRCSSFNGPFRIAMRPPVVADHAERIGFYVYNPRRRGMALDDAHVRVWELLP